MAHNDVNYEPLVSDHDDSSETDSKQQNNENIETKSSHNSNNLLDGISDSDNASGGITVLMVDDGDKRDDHQSDDDKSNDAKDSDHDDYNLRKLRTEQEIEQFLHHSMITLSDFDVLKIYIYAPISKLVNISFIIYNTIQLYFAIKNEGIITNQQHKYLQIGSVINTSFEFIGLVILLLTALVMYYKENYATCVDSLQLSGSFSTFKLFYECRPVAIAKYISTVIKNNEKNALETNIKHCKDWKQYIDDNDNDDVNEINNKLETYIQNTQHQLEGPTSLEHLFKESAYGLIVIFVFLGLAVGLLSFILKLYQLNFITQKNVDIVEWTLVDWFTCIAFANQLWNMNNIHQMKSFAIYELLYTNKQDISHFTCNKMIKMLNLDSIIKTNLVQRYKMKGLLIGIGLKYQHILQCLIRNPYEDPKKQKQNKDSSFLRWFKLSNEIQIDAEAEGRLFCETDDQNNIKQHTSFPINDYFPNFSFLFKKVQTKLTGFFKGIAIFSLFFCMIASSISVILYWDRMTIDNICDHELFLTAMVVFMGLIFSLLILIYINKRNPQSKYSLWALKVNITLLSVIILVIFSVFIFGGCIQRIGHSEESVQYIVIFVNLWLLTLFIAPVLIHLLVHPVTFIKLILYSCFYISLVITLISDVTFLVSIGIFMYYNFDTIKSTYYTDHFVIRIELLLGYYVLNNLYFIRKFKSPNDRQLGNLKFPKSDFCIQLATCVSYAVLISLLLWDSNQYQGESLTLLWYSALINCVFWCITLLPSCVWFAKQQKYNKKWIHYIMYHCWFAVPLVFLYLLSDIAIYALSICIVIQYGWMSYMYEDIFMYFIIAIIVTFSFHFCITLIKIKCDSFRCFELFLSISLDLELLGICIFVIETKQFDNIESLCILVLTFIILFGQILGIIFKCCRKNSKINKIQDSNDNNSEQTNEKVRSKNKIEFRDTINHVVGTIHVLKLIINVQ